MSNRAELTFHWTVENFRYCPQTTESVCSPAFCFGESDWQLLLYPRGRYDHDEVTSCFLTRKDKGPDRFPVEHAVSLGKSENDVQESSLEMREEVFAPNECSKFPYAEFRKAVLEACSPSFSSDSVLTVRCSMWSSEVQLHESKQVFASTHIKVQRTTLLWTIQTFENLSEEEKKVAISVQTAGADYPSFVLSLIGTGNRGITKKQIRFELLQTEGIRNFTELKVRVMDPDSHRGTIDILEAGRIFEPDEDRYTQSKFSHCISRYDCKPPGQTFWADDSLSLQCEFAISLGEYSGRMDMVSQTFQIKTVLPIHAGCGTPPKEARPLQVDRAISDPTARFRADLQRLYAEKLFCDYRLVAGSETFPVHKPILSARSQVFNAMFSSEMLEKSSDSLVIPDVDGETMNRMLLFVYADTVEKLELDSAMRLYFAADKYQLLSLKSQCSSQLKSEMTTSNAWDVLVLADMHQDSDLVTAVKDFIFSQDSRAVFSSEWTSFKDLHPKLACDIAIEMYKKSEKSEKTYFRGRREFPRRRTLRPRRMGPPGLSNFDDHLKDDFQRLYSEKSFCDFKLVVGSEIFHVHRSILSARSQVFSDMFNSETLEKSSDSLVLEDVDKDILSRMLLFVYTDSVEELDLESAVKLYFAAHNYQLLSLKCQCSSFLKSNLTTLNACEVLVLADMHQDKDLVTVVKDFIFSHDREVVFSSEFTGFKEEHSKLACDIVVEMYKKKLDPEEHFSLCMD